MLFELHLVQLVIKALVGYQFVVGAHFFNFAFIQHDDLAGFANGGKPVGDNDRRAAGYQCINGFLYKHFTFRIHGGSGFI